MNTSTALEASNGWEVPTVATVLETAATENGVRLMDLVDASPVLLVFLRHAGCTFCRESVADISKSRDEIERQGIRILLVHMGDREGMEALVARHHLSDVERIRDTEQALYKAFGLKRGTWGQLFGLKVWIRGFIAGIWHGHGLGRPVADPRQMPGVFFLERGLIARAYRHRSAADRPCYTDICDSREDR